MKTTDTLILNFTDKGLKPVLEMTQYDSGRKVTCYIAGVSGEIGLAEVYCIKPSGTEAYVNAEIINDHTVEFEVDPQMIAEEGTADCQLQIIGENNTLTSFEFSIKVEKNLVAGSRITSTDAYPALQQLLEDLSGLNPIPITEEEIDELKGGGT